MESIKKHYLQLCMHYVSAAKYMAQALWSWYLPISSWLRPALVLATFSRRLTISLKPNGLSSKLQIAAVPFNIDCIAVLGFSMPLMETVNRLCTTWQMISTFGLKSIEASGGYFHMANVFFHQNKMDIANSLYAEVTDIWHTFLVKSVQTQEQIRKLRAGKSPFTEDKEVEVSEDTMTEAQQAEAIQVLNAVLDIREKAPKQEPGETARVLHALAMLYYLILDLSKAREMGMKAFDLLKEQPQQESLEAISYLLKLIDSQPSCTK